MSTNQEIQTDADEEPTGQINRAKERADEIEQFVKTNPEYYRTRFHEIGPDFVKAGPVIFLSLIHISEPTRPY